MAAAEASASLQAEVPLAGATLIEQLINGEVELLPAEAEVQALACTLKISLCAARRKLARSTLPDGWAVCRTAEGEVYYQTVNGHAQWAHPGQTWEDDDLLPFASTTAQSGNAAVENVSTQSQQEFLWSSRDPRTGKWCRYPPDAERALEVALRTGRKVVDITHVLVALTGSDKRKGGAGSGASYSVRLSTMRQHNGHGGTRPVCRHPVGKPPSLQTAGKLVPPARRKNATQSQEVKAPPAPEQHSIYDARSRHTPLETPETLFSDAAYCVAREDLCGRAFALHGLLNQEEAAAYIQAAESSGAFATSDVAREFPTELRNNARLVHFSDALAKSLWHRIAPLLAHRDLYLIQPMGFGAEGRWKPIGVNPCFRLARYCAGEHFGSHCDGMYVDDEGSASIYSLVLYLNGDFAGGELQLEHESGPVLLKPRAGMAILFPHDVRHAAHAIQEGARAKYVMRSEVMFRRVDRGPPPSSLPAFVADPLFQRMAALYAQIGDLVVQADATSITAAYQEALGIQIAHQGTDTVSINNEVSFVLPSDTLVRALTFLSPAAALTTAKCSTSCRDSVESGMLWRELFQRHWPDSCEVVEDMLRQLDPELRDWLGLFRRRHTTEAESPVVAVYIDAMIHARLLGRRQLQPIRAIAEHNSVGIGWDVSFKQRAGWSVGDDGGSSWCKDNEIRFGILPEILSYVFQGLALRPGDHSVLIPALPGVWTDAARARIVRILMGRFEVPKVYVAPAPLCALLAHGFSTGTVVWGCDLGACRICCYNAAKEVATTGPFDFWNARPPEIVQLLVQAMESLGSVGDSTDTLRDAVFQHIVFSAHGVVVNNPHVAPEPTVWSWQRDGDPVGPYGLPWLDIGEILKLLRDPAQSLPRCLSQAELHASIGNDVLLGAEVLGAAPQELSSYEATPEEVRHWEWRRLVGKTWRKLPGYVAGVFETAFRAGARFSGVQVGDCDGFSHSDGSFGDYLIADLVRMEVALGAKTNPFTSEEARYRMCKTRNKLTRFLRGRFKPVPDRRKLDGTIVHRSVAQLTTEEALELYGARLLERHTDESHAAHCDECIVEDVPGDYADIVHLGDGARELVEGHECRSFKGQADLLAGASGRLRDFDPDEFPDELDDESDPRWPETFAYLGAAGPSERGHALTWDLCNVVVHSSMVPGRGIGRLLCNGFERAGFRRAEQLRGCGYAAFVRVFPGVSPDRAHDEYRDLTTQSNRCREHLWDWQLPAVERSSARRQIASAESRMRQLDTTPERLRLMSVRVVGQYLFSEEKHILPACSDAEYLALEEAWGTSADLSEWFGWLQEEEEEG